MALDDYLESEVVVAVAATAAVLSPRVRGVLRRGAVYGLAGVLMAGDAVSSAARNVAPGVQQAAASAAGTFQGAAQQVASSAASVAEEAAERARAATEGGEEMQSPRGES